MRSKKKNRGFSLVELMISMTLGLMVISGILYVYLNARASFSNVEALAYIQENARFAFDYMAKDIRLAGFTGGSSSSTSNVIATPSWDPNLIDLYDLPLIGYESSAPSGISGQLSSTDALTVVHANPDVEFNLVSAAPPNFVIECPNIPLYIPETGEIFVASDQTHSAVFQITAASSPPCSTSMTVAYGGTATPGNSGTDLGTFNGGSSGVGTLHLYRLDGATYYLANNSLGIPSLYRMQLVHDLATSTAQPTAIELVEGINDMQITYGVDTDDPEDGVINGYYSATQVNGSIVSGATSTEEKWNRVLSVRIALTLVSPKGIPFTDSGGALEKTYSITVAVRNRLL